MDSTAVPALLAGLLVGLVLGLAVTAVLARSRRQVQDAEERADGDRQQAELERARADADRAKGEAAVARGEAAESRTQLAEVQQRAAEAVAEAHRRVTEAVTEAKEAVAELAGVRAELSGVRAERDAALLRAEGLAADREALSNQFKVLSAETLQAQGEQADALAEQRLRATEALLAPVRDGLKAVNDRLSEVEKERVRLSTDLRAQVQAVQSTGESLRRETHALARALRKPQVRGAWGEMQLKRVAEVAGMVEHCDFASQQTTTADDKLVRPDMRVDLSDGKCVFVDSKVPLAAFMDAHETDDAREREEALQRFAQNVRTHVDQLSAKRYWSAEEGTPEFVVLFMPSEALAAEAFSVLPDLHDYAAARDVVLATPTTLIAMLRAVAYGWKQAKLAESAADVLRLGRELHNRLGTLGGHFDKVGRGLQSAVKAYNQTLGTLETRVMVSARRFRDLKVTDAELDSYTPVEEPVRTLVDAELVEDAAQVEPIIGRSRRAAITPGREHEAVFDREPTLDEVFDVTTPAEEDRRRHA
ncbi:DNA recombination protein RmuC [Auraticoccus sp. F435]|uniref:DNA recombination protein RmuC n=1 Tax=Auraticoccus cholistanensis TaxID=2656650 RepID=A0A6A9V0V0_9ACTN|nr:DNA recombination protein RmuC [Auraticoccus cholistanensis]MVA76289.1 DNA recombination protein RmuC [Auraticoccus cholistanensis]